MHPKPTALFHFSNRSLALLPIFSLLLAWLAGSASPVIAGDTPDLKGAAATIRLTCGGGAQFEIRGPDGQRVFTDVADPSEISSPATERDVLLTTHFDFDHFDKAFVDTFPGEHMHGREGNITRPGVTITSIGGHHSEHTWKTIKTSEGTNHLFVIEMAGIRIAHFGDIGQPRFSPGQLKALGRIDIAITQFINQYSQMDLKNQKGYRLMDQIQPKLIIPHHGSGSEEAIRLAMDRWEVACAPEPDVTLSKDMLPKKTTVLLMGGLTEYMQKAFDLKFWPKQ